MNQAPFHERIKSFNQMYGLDSPNVPTYTPALRARLERFKQIILDEISEVDDIIISLPQDPNELLTSGSKLGALTELSDWLGDIIVYAASEMVRHGLPIEGVLSVIMDSNASKLDANGNPIVVDGKVQKGPNYWKPEPKIKELLLTLQQAGKWTGDPQ